MKLLEKLPKNLPIGWIGLQIPNILCRLRLSVYDDTKYPRKYTDEWYEIYSMSIGCLQLILSLLTREYTKLNSLQTSLLVSTTLGLYTCIKAYNGKYYTDMQLTSGKPSFVFYIVSNMIVYNIAGIIINGYHLDNMYKKNNRLGIYKSKIESQNCY